MRSGDGMSGTTPLRRVVAASMIGTTIEWYDFFLYNSAAALVFNRLFFPQFDPLTGTLLAFATYALGFVARPLGGIVFGHYGDRIGRKRLLMLSLILMGVATVLIGLLPTYEAIGIGAPIALIVLRLAQGFAVGGEWGGAVLMAAEHGDAARRGFWASWPQAGVAAGFLLSAGMLAAINGLQSEAEFLAWGWRVPFLASVVLVVVGWYIRNRVAESRLFEEAIARGRSAAEPAGDGRAARAAGLGRARHRHQVRRECLLLHPHRLLAHLPRRHLGAEPRPRPQRVDDRHGAAILRDPARRLAFRPHRTPARLCLRRDRPHAAWSFALFPLLASGDAASIVLALVVGLVLHGVMYGPQAAMMAELFPTRIRYSGASISYQFTAIIAGSLAPIIAVWLYRSYGSAVPVALYVAIACAISGVSALLARETKGIELADIR